MIRWYAMCHEYQFVSVRSQIVRIIRINNDEDSVICDAQRKPDDMVMDYIMNLLLSRQLITKSVDHTNSGFFENNQQFEKKNALSFKTVHSLKIINTWVNR